MLDKTSIIKNHKKPSNILFKWIISYMSILIIPLLICSLYYCHSYQVIKEEAIDRQHLALKNIKTQLDNNFNDLLRISTNMQLNQQVNSFSYKNASSPVIHQQVSYLIDELSIFMLTNSFIKDIYIYFSESDYIVTSSSIFKYNLTSHMPSRYISQNTWEHLKNTFYKDSNPLLLVDRDSKMLFVNPLITNNKTDKPLSFIVFEINQDNFNTFLYNQQMLGDFSSLILMDNNEFILSTNSDIPKYLHPFDIVQTDDNLSSIKSSITMHLSGKQKINYILDSVNFNLLNLNLVSFTEKTVYNNETSNILIILFISVFISILLGSIITWFYSMHNYRPIKDIMNCLRFFPSESEERNEYSKIKNTILKTNSELKIQRDLLKNNYLFKLLTGEIQLSEVSTSLATQFQINFTSDYSYVVLLQASFLHDCGKEPFLTDIKKTADDLIFFITQNVLQEILEPSLPHIHFCYNQNKIAMIVNISDHKEEKETILSEGLNTFITYCKNNFDINCMIGISDLCDNTHLPAAYTQANNTIEYMRLFSTGNLRHYKETPKESQINYLHLKTSEYIINLVTSADEHTLKDYFHTIYQELEKKNLSSEDAKSCLYFFYSVSMRLKAQLQQYPYTSTEAIFVLTNEFFNYCLLDAIHYVENLYIQAIQVVRTNTVNSTDEKMYLVTQYIESNYLDCNLNLNSIAAHFNITPSYLSKKFRQSNGESIIDYLYKIRISHSVTLIKDTSLKINEIAQMVGFQDSNAFIRIFKKYYGSTPGNYKNTILNLSD